MTDYFKPIKLLGEGGYGRVYGAVVTAQGKSLNPAMPDQVAIKVLTVPKRHMPDLRNELDILKKLQTPRAVKYYGCFVQGKSGQLNIIMELVEGRTLANLLEQAMRVELFRPHAANIDKIRIAQGTALAISEIHAVDLVHRDIKLENVMITNDYAVKLVDFGLACDLVENPGSTTCTNRVGTPTYVDPKVIPGNLESMKQADWWSYGQLVLRLFTFAMDPAVPEALKPLLRALTDPALEQDQRPTATDILRALRL
jgi:serine/threonine protein kinase